MPISLKNEAVEKAKKQPEDTLRAEWGKLTSRIKSSIANELQALFLLCFAHRPLRGKGAQIIHALEQIAAAAGEDVARIAMANQGGSAQFFEACVQGIWCDAAHAVLQQAEGLRMAIFQSPEHAHCVA